MGTQEQGTHASYLDMKGIARDSASVDLFPFNKNEGRMRGNTTDKKESSLPLAWCPHSRVMIGGIMKGRWVKLLNIANNKKHRKRFAWERVIEYLVDGYNHSDILFAVSRLPRAEVRAYLFVLLNGAKAF